MSNKDNKDNKALFRRLGADDVVLGQPLRWAVHDAAGHLLLAKGELVKTELQRSRLVNQRVFIDISNDAASSIKRAGANDAEAYRPRRIRSQDVFSWVDQRLQILEQSYAEISLDPGPESIARIRSLVIELQRAADEHHDGLLAAAYLNPQKHSYAHSKALHVALLCNELGRSFGLGIEKRWSLIAAGLTHDIGMWQMQNEIQRREAPLSDEQWQLIRGHCNEGVRLLRQAGVTDPVWLSAVEQHHERLNGSGYPQGLDDSRITAEAKILAIADVFAAMVRTRGDRSKRVPKDAMREIFMSRGEDIDGTLVQLFIKKLGMFPPGCMVRLVTGEVGVATGPGINATSPDVEVIVDASGKPLLRSEYRDTTSKSYAVRELVMGIDHPGLKEMLPKMWKEVPVKAS